MKAEGSRMLRAAAFSLASLLSLALSGPAVAKPSAPQLGVSAVALDPPVDFVQGEQLRLKLTGSADNVQVRLVPKGAAQDADVGLVGGPVKVPASRVVNIVLPEDRKGVAQIAVQGNAPALIVSYERILP